MPKTNQGYGSDKCLPGCTCGHHRNQKCSSNCTCNRHNNGKNKGFKSESHKRAMSVAAKKRWNNPEEKEKMINIHLNSIKRSPNFTKGFIRSQESKNRQSATRKVKYADGTLTPAKGVGRGRGAYIYSPLIDKIVWVRSTWEQVFVNYCNVAGIKWNYESVRVYCEECDRTHPIDFLVDNELYDPGYADKHHLVKSCKEAGYICHVNLFDELKIMALFIGWYERNGSFYKL